MTKPPLASLRLKDQTIAIEVVDLSTAKDTFADCSYSVIQAMGLFSKFGFVIRPVKSHFVPSQMVTYLGFIINSEKMTVYLPNYKEGKLHEKCKFVTLNRGHKTMAVARFIGLLTFTFPGNKTGLLYYRVMLKGKDDSLKYNFENFNPKLILTKDALLEVEW